MTTRKLDPIPIREDESGVLRVGESRVLLEIVIHAFEDGETPESIVQGYDTLRLADVYAVIAYYLHHREEIADYLRQREVEAGRVRAMIEAAQPDLGDIRARLLRRRESGALRDAAPGGG